MRYRKHAFHPLIIGARIAALLISATLAMPAGAATYIVTNLDDSGSGSLRQAVLDANASFVSDTINFASSLSGGTLTLASQIGITDKLTINGLGSDKLTISGNKKTRIFLVNSAGAVIQDMTLRDGLNEYGGAINNAQQLTLNRLSLTGSSGYYYGGAIYNAGVLTANQLTLWENGDKNLHGGAIYNTGTLNLKDSNLWKNYSSLGGAGLYNDNGNLTVLNSFIGFNSAGGSGGGICSVKGAVTLENSTLSENTARNSGGGLYADSVSLAILNSTIAGNAAVNAGGGINATSSTSGTIGNSIVAGNSAGKGNVEIDATGKTFVSIGGNLFGVSGKAGVNSAFIPLDTDQTLAGELNTVVGEIGENEEWPYVRVLVSGSQAIDGGINELVPAELRNR
jgi:predicted outer membrane repeat protein